MAEARPARDGRELGASLAQRREVITTRREVDRGPLVPMRAIRAAPGRFAAVLATPQPAVAGDLRFDPGKPVVANIAEQRHETRP